MPANFNALTRYRNIDKCLSNPYREWTIGDLMEACSSALEVSRVLKFMLELKSETDHPGMDEIINSIGAALYRQSESSDFASELPPPGKVESSVQEPDYLRLRVGIPNDGLKWSWILDHIPNFS